MPKLSELFVELKLQADNFQSGLKDAQREARAFEKSIKPSLDLAKEMGAAMAVAGTAITGSMLAMSKAAVDYGDALNDARQRTGASVESLARLGFAAEQSGSSFEGLSTGMKFLAKNMESAIAKGGDQRAAFEALGISSKQLTAANGDMNKVFMLIADRFKELPDGAEKSALAMKIFGKSTTDLIPMLNEGSTGLKKLGDDAQRAGLVISQDMASASDQLNDTLNEMKASMMGASASVAEALLPTLQSAANVARDGIQAFNGFAKEHQGLTQAAFALGGVLATVGTGLVAIAVVVPKLQAGFLQASKAIELMGGAMNVASGVAIVALIASLYQLYKAYQDVIEAEGRLAVVQAQSQGAANNAIKTLREHGIAVDTAGMSEDGRTRALARAGQELQKKMAAEKLATAATKTHTAAVTLDEDAINKQAAALKAAKKVWEETKAKIDEANAAQLKVDATLTVFATNQQNAIKATEGLRGALTDGAEAVAVFDAALIKVNSSAAQASYETKQMQKDLDSLYGTKPPMDVGPIKLASDFDALTQAAKNSSPAMKAATEDIKNSAGKIFDDMFVKGESVFASLRNALKGGALSLGRAIFEDITGALLGPIKKVFDDFLKSIVGGIGSRLGSVVGGALGIGGSAAGAAAGVGGAGAAGAGAGAAGAGTMGSLGAFFTNPITIGVGAAALAAISFVKSQAHWEANKLVKEIENPFWQQWSQILPSDRPDDLRSLGSEQAQDIGMRLSSMNERYLALVQAFEGGGSDERKVGEQSLANTQPHVMQVLAALREAVTGGGGVPMFERGTPYVERTGPAIVHQGERIIPAKENDGLLARLDRLIALQEQGLRLFIDGKEIGRVMAPVFYKGTRDEGWQLIGAR